MAEDEKKGAVGPAGAGGAAMSLAVNNVTTACSTS
jgi:hypothetical protein